MNKKLINEWGAAMPKSNPYKEPKRPSKPLTPKKPNNPWKKSGWEEPEDAPVEKRRTYNPNNWKNESRNMKKLIRLTESDLHRIVKESVERILVENGENEIGDRFEKELGLPKGGGKYFLARKAQQAALRQGRTRQAKNFQDYGLRDFNKNFGVESKPGDERIKFKNYYTVNDRGIKDGKDLPVLDYEGQEYRYDKTPTYRGTQGEDLKKQIPNMKAYPRSRITNGLETWDKDII
jgi:hypothetical protein